jgi:hypothetical protein
MKMNYLIIPVLVLFSTIAQAQWIQTITTVPPAPTSNDTIRIVAHCVFPSGSCSEHAKFISVNGNTIDAYAIHCLGMLSVICNYTDTFIVSPLPAGNYTFRMTLEAGSLPAPCAPIGLPSSYDSLQFVVIPATGIGEFIGRDDIKAIPNPASGSFILSGLHTSDYPATLQLFTTEGKKALAQSVFNNDEQIKVDNLPSGMYQLHLTSKTGENIVIPLMISR